MNLPPDERAPGLEFALELNVTLGPFVDVGPTPYGFRRIIEIRSGTFSGPGLKGTLLEGGADWQMIRADHITELQAHYILATDDGVLIQVKVRGLRHAVGDALARIAAGEMVDPAGYYFRTAPIFEAPVGPYEWLNRSLFIATGDRRELSLTLRIFRVI